MKKWPLSAKMSVSGISFLLSGLLCGTFYVATEIEIWGWRVWAAFNRAFVFYWKSVDIMGRFFVVY